MYGLTEAFRSTSLDPGAGRRPSRQRRHRHPLRRDHGGPRRRQRSRAGRGGRAGPCRAAGRPGLLARSGAHRRAVQAGAGSSASWRHGGLVGRHGGEGRGRPAPLPRPRRRDDQGQRQPDQPDRDRGSGARQRRGQRGGGARRSRRAAGPGDRAGRGGERRGRGGEAARLSPPRTPAAHAAAADHLARRACRSARTASSTAPR